MGAPEAVLELVERFARNRAQYLNPAYNETQVRREFLDPFFTALGWDVDNTSGHAQQYKDVVHEDAIKVGLDSRAPDYSFRVGGQRKFFVEAKKPAVNLKDDPAPAYQLRRYAWSAKLPLSILTDFQELAVYDGRVKPAAIDKPSAARTLHVPCEQYDERWDEIANSSLTGRLSSRFPRAASIDCPSCKIILRSATLDATRGRRHMSQELQSIGGRIKAARAAAGMKQEELALAVGFASRQILSDLERGVRDVKASEAARIARLLHLDLSSLLSEPQAKPRVLWRAKPSEGSEPIEATFLQWCDRQRRVLRLLDQKPPDQLPSYDRDLAQMTYADSDRLARDVGRSLDLGARPARALCDALESQFDVTIWYLDTPPGCAACTRGAHGVSILVPCSEAPWRRYFDIAHELFHLLTWTATEREMSVDGTSAPSKHTEQLANAFAASLLLPGELVLRELEERSSARRVKLAELVAMARDFSVALDTLVWRLHNLGCWPDRAAVDDLLGNPRLRELDRASQAGEWSEPTHLPERFVQSAYAATLRGRLSRTKLATYLQCGLPELPACLAAYGIDEGLAELTSQDISLEFQTGDLDPIAMPCEQE